MSNPKDRCINCKYCHELKRLVQYKGKEEEWTLPVFACLVDIENEGKVTEVRSFDYCGRFEPAIEHKESEDVT